MSDLSLKLNLLLDPTQVAASVRQVEKRLNALKVKIPVEYSTDPRQTGLTSSSAEIVTQLKQINQTLGSARTVKPQSSLATSESATLNATLVRLQKTLKANTITPGKLKTAFSQSLGVENGTGFQDLIEAVKANHPTFLSSVFTGVGESVGRIVTENIGTIGQALEQVFDKYGVNEKLVAGLKTVDAVTRDFLAKAQSALDHLIDSFPPGVADLFTDTAAKLPALFDTLAKTVANVEKIEDIFLGLAESLPKSVKQAISKIQEKVPASFRDAFSSVLGKFSAELDRAFSPLASSAEDALNIVKTKLAPVADQLKSVAEAQLSKLPLEWLQYLDAFSQKVSGLSAVTSQIVSATFEEIKQEAIPAFDKFKNLTEILDETVVRFLNKSIGALEKELPSLIEHSVLEVGGVIAEPLSKHLSSILEKTAQGLRTDIGQKILVVPQQLGEAFKSRIEKGFDAVGLDLDDFFTDARVDLIKGYETLQQSILGLLRQNLDKIVDVVVGYAEKSLGVSVSEGSRLQFVDYLDRQLQRIGDALGLSSNAVQQNTKYFEKLQTITPKLEESFKALSTAVPTLQAQLQEKNRAAGASAYRQVQRELTALRDAGIPLQTRRLNVSASKLRAEKERVLADPEFAEIAKKILSKVGDIADSSEESIELAQVTRGRTLGVLGGSRADIEYKRVAQLVASMSSIKLESFGIPGLEAVEDLPESVNALYVPTNNLIKVSKDLVDRLGQGLLKPEDISALVHELRHAVQFESGKLSLDEAVNRATLQASAIENEAYDIKGLASESAKAVTSSIEQQKQLQKLEEDAYTFQLRATQAILDQLRLGGEQGLKYRDIVRSLQEETEKLDRQVDEIFSDLTASRADKTSKLARAASYQKEALIVASGGIEIDIPADDIKQAQRQLRELAKQVIKSGGNLEDLADTLNVSYEDLNEVLYGSNSAVRALNRSVDQAIASSSALDKSLTNTQGVLGQASVTAREFGGRLTLSTVNVRDAFKNLAKSAFELVKGFVFFEIASHGFELLIDSGKQVVQIFQQFQSATSKLSFALGEPEKTLSQLFDLSQKIGVDYQQLTAGFGDFASAIKGTSLAAQGLDIFEDISTVMGEMQLSTAETKGIFLALTQMVAKGTVSMEELRGQLAERLPQGFSATIAAVQDMVNEGLIPLEAIAPHIVNSAQDVREAYQVTSADVIKYISQGLLATEQFLPYLSKQLAKGVESTSQTLNKESNRLRNYWVEIQRSIGEQITPALAKALGTLNNALSTVFNNMDNIVLGFRALFVVSVAAGLAALSSFVKSAQAASAAIAILNLNITGLIASVAKFAVFGKVTAWLAATTAGAKGLTAAILVIKAAALNTLKTITAAALSNPFTAALVAAAAFAAFAEPLGEAYFNATNKIDKQVSKLNETLDSTGASFDNLGRAFSEGQIVDQSQLDQARAALEAAAGGAEKLQALLDKKTDDPMGLSVTETELVSQVKLLDDLNKKNQQRVDQVEALEEALDAVQKEEQALTGAYQEQALALKESLATGAISESTYNEQLLQAEKENSQKRLENARATIAALDAIESSPSALFASADALEQRNNAREQAEQTILDERNRTADLLIQSRKEQIEKDIELIRESGDKLARETAQAELQRIEAIRQLAAEGDISVEQANKERLDLTEERIEQEIQLETKRIETLKALADQAVEGSQEQSTLLDQIVQAEQQRSNLITERAAFEIERQAAVERQTEAAILQLDIEQAQLDNVAKLAALQNELAQTQNTLAQSKFELVQAQLGLEQTLANNELQRLEFAIEANQLLLQIDSDRRDAVAERLGLDEGQNEIELARQREIKEQEIAEQKHIQLDLQRQAERQQLEFEKAQVAFQAKQQRSQVKLAQIDAHIANLKSNQAISSAMVARSTALAAGDTERAAQAELEMLQARQQLQLASDQADLLTQELAIINQQERTQNKILETREQILDAAQQQQQVELDTEVAVSQQSRELRAQQELLAANTRSRDIQRNLALESVRSLGAEAALVADIAQSRNELADLQAQYERQLAIVADLESTSVQNDREQLILTEAQNELHQTSLALLQAESQLEEQLLEANQQRQRALLEASLITLRSLGSEASLVADIAQSRNELTDLQARYGRLQEALSAAGQDELQIAGIQNELQQTRLDLLQAELQLEDQLAKADQQRQHLLRETSLTALRSLGSEAALVADIAQSRNELADLQARYGQLQEALSAAGQDELLTAGIQNELQQTRLDLLQVELRLEDQLSKADQQRQRLLRETSLTALRFAGDEANLAASILETRTELADLQDQYRQQLKALNIAGQDELQTAGIQNELHQTRLDLLQTELQLEERLANQVSRQREQALQRQVDVLEQRKALIEAETGLATAQSNLRTAQLEGELIDIEEEEQLRGLSKADADKRRAEIRLEILDEEKKVLEAQQKADAQRLEIEQEIEISRLRAAQAEAEVTKARAELARAEAQNALARARETGDAQSIAAAEAAVEASDAGIKAAQNQVNLLDEQLKSAIELQEIQMETLESQQEADRQRLENRERELRLAREIASLSGGEGGNTGFRVAGGGVSAGNNYTVGERGAELFKGVDGSTQIVGLAGQQSFTPHVPGTIVPNTRLEQQISASVMRSDTAVVQAIERGFKTSGRDFSRLAGVLANRTAKPVTVNNYGNNTPGFDMNGSRLTRL